jgi:3-isopropylmalate/(R)-2-methylmalate dehydratase small subunit
MGRTWKYGDDINTDLIFPGKYLYLVVDPQEMASHALEGLDADFAQRVRRGDIIVAGKNFGCGSSREQAVTCLKYAKVGAVLATSFSRIFFRNAINMGLPAIECPDAAEAVEKGETLRIDLIEGVLESQAGRFRFPSIADFALEIIQDGGLIPHTRKLLKSGSHRHQSDTDEAI